MKRRQHVGKKRAKVRTRRKSRRDTVKGVAREAHEAGTLASVSVDTAAPAAPQVDHRVYMRLDDLEAFRNRVIKAFTPPQRPTPNLTPGTVIRDDSFVADNDGVLWHISPAHSFCERA